MTITVDPVNDAPVASARVEVHAADAGTSKAISGVSVSDVDSNKDGTNVSVSRGGPAVNAGDMATNGGNHTGSVTISGALAQIDSAPGGLACNANVGYSGSDTLTVAISGGTLSDTDLVTGRPIGSLEELR